MNPNVAKVEDAVRRSRPGGEIRGVKGEAVVTYREPLTVLRRRINSGDAVSSAFPTCLAEALAEAGG